MEMIPALPGSLKALLFPPVLNKARTRERKGCQARYGRGTSSIHCYGPAPLVVQSYIYIYLGGSFGPEKKIFSPPPPNSPQTPSQPLTPPAPTRPGDPPPLLGFSVNNRSSPVLAPRTPLSPPPSRKNKKYPKRPPRYWARILFRKRAVAIYLNNFRGCMAHPSPGH